LTKLPGLYGLAPAGSIVWLAAPAAANELIGDAGLADWPVHEPGSVRPAWLSDVLQLDATERFLDPADRAALELFPADPVAWSAAHDGRAPPAV
jgi:hypothetical protein